MTFKRFLLKFFVVNYDYRVYVGSSQVKITIFHADVGFRVGFLLEKRKIF